MTYPYPMPKSRTIIRLHSHLSAGLAPHGISCHYKSDKQLLYNVLIRCIFAPSEYDRGKNALRRNRHAASVAQQSDDRRILCSNEQSKLCFRQTKTVLSDRNCALQRSAETLLRSRNSRRKEVQIQNQTDGEDNTNNLNLKSPQKKGHLKFILRQPPYY